MLQDILATVTFVFLSLYIIFKIVERKRLPPGPFSFPFIGNYRGFHASMIYKRMTDNLVPTYGKLVTLFWGNTPIVFINDYQLTVDALGTKNGKSLAGRKSVQTEDIVSEERHNIFGNNYGPLWKEMISTLKLGIIKCGLTSTLEINSKNAIDLFCKELISNSENYSKGVFPFDESYWLSDNIVLSILIGKIFQLHEEDYHILQDSRRQTFDIMDKCEYVNWIPFGRYLPLKCIRDLTTMSKKLNDLLAKFINNIRMKNKYLTNPDNVIEYILKEIENNKKNKEKSIILNDIHVRQIFKDILFASYEGIGMTNIWYMALLGLHPTIQENIRSQITKFCKDKNDFIPKFEWRTHLPYIQAVEFEFFRFSSIVGILDFHCALKSVKLGGYSIPKGSLIAINQYALNHDPERWEDPESVNPERFLDSNGDFTDRSDLMPFGMGIRMCPGTLITKGYGFLLLCNLCLNYKIEWSSDNEFKNMVDDPDNAVLFRFPKEYLVKIVKIDGNQ